MFTVAENQAKEITFLRSELASALESVTELTQRATQVTTLQAEIRNMKSQLRDAQRITENAVEVAEQAKNATMVARSEQEACLIKSKEDRKAKEDMRDEMQQLKIWLDSHQKEVREMLPSW